MSSFSFLACCFLIIIACSEGAVTDAKKIEARQTCSTADFPSGCTLSGFQLLALLHGATNSQLTNLNQQYSRICTKACVSAVTEYYRCRYSEDDEQELLEYEVNLAHKYICGQHNGKYCAVRNANITVEVSSAYSQVLSSCTRSSTDIYNAITCSSSSSTLSNCTNALSTVSSYMGCCTEPLFGSGVRSCSGASIPEACTGVSASSTGVSSATGIMATAPIVAVSLMVFALVGVLL